MWSVLMNGNKKPDKAFEPYPAYRKVTPSNISAVHLGIALLPYHLQV